jgi:hypothetical protein
MKILSVESSQILTDYFMVKLKLPLRVQAQRNATVWERWFTAPNVLNLGANEDKLPRCSLFISEENVPVKF